MRTLVAQMPERVVQHSLTGARPVSVTDGVDVSSWRSGPYGPTSAEIYLDGSQAVSLTGGTIGVELWGLKLGQWWLLGSLNAGAAIPIVSDTLGAAQRVADVLGGFDRLFVAGTTSAGTVNAQFVPLEVIL
jgi:hypothetical protein